jgi:hypothetical protein
MTRFWRSVFAAFVLFGGSATALAQNQQSGPPQLHVEPTVPWPGCGGGIFNAACNLTHGGLSPADIAKQSSQGIANAVNDKESLLSVSTLEQAIISSHNTAINGAMPIPPQIRQQLTGYASEESMNLVRYKIGDDGFANLAHLLEQGGPAAAVTLIDIVVFRGPSEAADPSIWAHALTHVDQYQAWGVHSFAMQYARNWRSVEDSAYAKGNGYQAWAASQGNGMAGQAVPPPSAPPQVAVGAFCYTQAGRFGPGPLQPIGSPCFVGQFSGQVGM